MITLRYHIASLAAVLLTLGLGIWIGLAIGSPGLTAHETALIKDASSKLDQVLAERQQDVQMLQQNRQALAGLVPHFTRAILTNKRVAIIRTGDYPDAAQAAIDALSQTGAVIVSSTSISAQFDSLSDKQRANILTPLSPGSKPEIQPGDNGPLFQALAVALKVGTANRPDLESAIDMMASANVISYSGDFQKPVDLIVVVGGSSSDPGELDASDDQARERAVLQQLVTANGFPAADVVGCESRDVATSSIPIFQEAGIGSVDCIDEPLGVLDLVYALHGETATYGIKQGATLLAPASLETSNAST